jgi:hypothetical protein
LRDGRDGRFGSLKRSGAESGSESNPKLQALALWQQLDHDNGVMAEQAQGSLRTALCRYFLQIASRPRAARVRGDARGDVVPVDDHERRARDHG